MAGVILLSTMAVGSIVLWRKRKKENMENSQFSPDENADSMP